MTLPAILAIHGLRRRSRRTSLLGAFAVTMLAFGVTMGGNAVSAFAASPPASQVPNNGAGCTLSNGWGGNFFCQGDWQYWEQMPNGYWEVFVVGPDDAVWTRWSTSSGLSSWRSLGGKCLLYVAITGSNGWQWTIECTAQSGNGVWDKARLADGNWTGWYRVA